MSAQPPTRVLPLVLLVASAACGAGPSDVRFVDDFIARSTAVECRPAPIARRDRIGDAVALGDTSLLVLYPDAREVVAYDADLRPAHTVAFAEEGPTGVADAVSATPGGDGTVYIADRRARLLKRLDVDGRDRGTIRLSFSPHLIRTAPGGLLVAPLLLAGDPEWLLYVVRPGREPFAVHVPPTRYTDLTVNALANMTIPAVAPDGELIVAHQFLVPAAFRAAASPTGRPVRHALPLPDGVRSTVGRIPVSPITESQFGRITTAAIAMAVDGESGDVLYVTRTGRRRGGASEKAIIRVDRDFAYRRSYLLDVNAAHLVYLAGRRVSLVANEENAWHLCPTP